MFGICAVYVQYLSSHSLNIYWTYTGEVLDIYWTTIEGKLWVHLGYVMGISKRYKYCIESPMGKRHGIFPFRHDGMQMCQNVTEKFRKAYAKIIKAFARKLAVCSQKIIIGVRGKLVSYSLPASPDSLYLRGRACKPLDMSNLGSPPARGGVPRRGGEGEGA